MKNRNLITTPDNSTLYPSIISSILDFAKENEIEVSDTFKEKLKVFTNSFALNSFLELAIAISTEKNGLFPAFTTLIKANPNVILAILKEKYSPDTTPTQNTQSAKYHRQKKADIDQSDSDDEDDEEEKKIDKPSKYNTSSQYHRALTFSLALGQIYLTQPIGSINEAAANIHAILNSITKIIQENPAWKDSNTQKALFIEAVEFIISKMNDNQLIAKLVNWISPATQKYPSQTFQFLHEQTGLVSRTFTASYVKIVDCAKNKIIENANHQTQAPNSDEETAVKSMLKIETGLGKHAPNFFNHQPKHLEEYEKIISLKKSIPSNKPEH